MRTLLVIASLVLSTQALRSPPRVDGVIAKQPRVDPSYYRLPSNVVPSAYTILLEPFLLNDTFRGFEYINVRVLEETDTITFHTAQIEFLETTVVKATGESVDIIDETVEEDRDFRILHFGQNLDVGDYVIFINYVGQLNGHNTGFYRSNYTNSNGEFV